MHKVVKEIKRGQPIPVNSVWLKEITKRENIKEHQDHDLLAPYETWDNATYDVYEILVIGETK